MQTIPAFSSFTSVKRATGVDPSKLQLQVLSFRSMLFLSLVILAGLPGCGPASSDDAPNLGARARVDGAALSQQGSSPRTDQFIPAASPVSLASGNETGLEPGKGTVAGGDSLLSVAPSATKPVNTVDLPVVPAWIAKERDSPEVGSKPHTLETWAQSAQPGAFGR